VTGRVVLLAGATAAVVVVVVVLVAGVAAVLTGGGRAAVGASAAAVADIPPPMLALYQRAAATCPGLDWAVLAAVGKVESDHGRSRLPGVTSGENPAGAAGPMQFLAPTFTEVIAAHPPPPGGARPPSRYDPHDAVHAAGSYLCDSGARAIPARPGGDIRAALFRYNRSTAYVQQVLDQAGRYRVTPALTGDGAPVVGQGGRGAVAVSYARGQLGLPYLWGGDGPAAGEGGFDCSGLTTAAWAAAGVRLPRTAHTQYQALAARASVPLDRVQAGDLFFFGTPDRVHHVGIATGQGTRMIHAPQRGSTVRVADATTLPDLLAVGRPT
jgi:hypothetical protein